VADGQSRVYTGLGQGRKYGGTMESFKRAKLNCENFEKKRKKKKLAVCVCIYLRHVQILVTVNMCAVHATQILSIRILYTHTIFS
jgi:hypothetical protein